MEEGRVRLFRKRGTRNEKTRESEEATGKSAGTRERDGATESNGGNGGTGVEFAY